jgi:hypothetical protein
VPERYLTWASERIPHFDLQLERLKQGLEPIPGLNDGTKAIPVAKPPAPQKFVSIAARPNNLPTMNKQPSRAENAAPYRQRLEALIADGLSLRQIVDAMQMPHPTVRQYIKALGLPKPQDGRKSNGGKWTKTTAPAKPKSLKGVSRIAWTKATRTSVAKLRGQGLEWNTIAEQMQFEPGGLVLQQRYNSHLGSLREECRTTRKPPTKPTPVTHWWGKRWLIRFLDWFGGE